MNRFKTDVPEIELLVYLVKVSGIAGQTIKTLYDQNIEMSCFGL
jgi:hypothetical protein